MENLTCDCGTTISLAGTTVGRAIQCPGCGKAIAVPDSQEPIPLKAEEAPPEPAAAATPLSPPQSLTEIGEPPAPRTKPATTLVSPPEALRAESLPCPMCHTPLPAGARLCHKCGYNVRTHRRPPRSGSWWFGDDRHGPSGMQMTGGLTICAITAALGTLAWFGLVVATGREFPLFAWLIGICCGTAMFLGVQRRSFSGGVIAATLTAAAIFAARWLIFQNILVPALQSPAVSQDDLSPLVRALMPPPTQAPQANIAEQIRAEWQRQITVTQTGTSQPATDTVGAMPATQPTAPFVLGASLFWAAMFSTGTWFRLALSCLSAFAIVGVFARE